MWHTKGVYVQLSDKSSMTFIDSLILYIIGGSGLVWKFSEVVYV
jgi:hypothetical protein